MTLPLNAMTPRARLVLVLAGAIAEDAGHRYIGTEHLLLALAQERKGIAAQVLERRDVREEVMQDLQAIIDTGGSSGNPPDPGDEVQVLVEPQRTSNHPLKVVAARKL